MSRVALEKSDWSRCESRVDAATCAWSVVMAESAVRDYVAKATGSLTCVSRPGVVRNVLGRCLVLRGLVLGVA